MISIISTPEILKASKYEYTYKRVRRYYPIVKATFKVPADHIPEFEDYLNHCEFVEFGWLPKKGRLASQCESLEMNILSLMYGHGKTVMQRLWNGLHYVYILDNESRLYIRKSEVEKARQVLEESCGSWIVSTDPLCYLYESKLEEHKSGIGLWYTDDVSQIEQCNKYIANLIHEGWFRIPTWLYSEESRRIHVCREMLQEFEYTVVEKMIKTWRLNEDGTGQTTESRLIYAKPKAKYFDLEWLEANITQITLGLCPTISFKMPDVSYYALMEAYIAHTRLPMKSYRYTPDAFCNTLNEVRVEDDVCSIPITSYREYQDIIKGIKTDGINTKMVDLKESVVLRWSMLDRPTIYLDGILQYRGDLPPLLSEDRIKAEMLAWLGDHTRTQREPITFTEYAEMDIVELSRIYVTQSGWGYSVATLLTMNANFDPLTRYPLHLNDLDLRLSGVISHGPLKGLLDRSELKMPEFQGEVCISSEEVYYTPMDVVAIQNAELPQSNHHLIGICVKIADKKYPLFHIVTDELWTKEKIIVGSQKLWNMGYFLSPLGLVAQTSSCAILIPSEWCKGGNLGNINDFMLRFFMD